MATRRLTVPPSSRGRSNSLEAVRDPYSTLAQPNQYLQGAYIVLCILAAIFLFEGSFKLTSRNYHMPTYAHHDHHLCHSFLMLMFCLVLWYVALTLLLVTNTRAMKSEWGKFLSTYPVLVIGSGGSVGCTMLWWMRSSHDEITFVFITSFMCGGVLLVNTLMNIVYIRKALTRNDQQFAFQWVTISFGFVCLLVAVAYANNLKVITLLGSVCSALYAIGLYTHSVEQNAKNL